MPEYKSFEEEMAADAKKNAIWNETKAIIRKNKELVPKAESVEIPAKEAKRPKRQYLQAREVAAYTSGVMD